MAALSFEEFAGTAPQTLSFEEFAAGGPTAGDTAVEEIGQNILEVPKGVIPGAVQFGGTVLKGVAAGKVSVERHEIEAADVLRRALAMSPAELSQARREVRRNLGTVRGGFFDRALSEVMAGEDPEDVIRANYPETISAEPRVAESSIYQAGEAVGEFGRELIPAAPGYEQSIGRQLGEGLGSMAVGAATSLVLGPAGAAGAFMFAGSGEAVERAIQAGATEEQIIEAARLGHYPGLTDTIPVEVLTGRLPLPGGKAIRPIFQIARRIGWQALIEGVQEGGQEWLQNLIAREVHTPEQRLTEGILPAGGLGAGVGALAETLATPFRQRGGRPSLPPSPTEAIAPPPTAPETQPPPAPTATAAVPVAETTTIPSRPEVITPEYVVKERLTVEEFDARPEAVTPVTPAPVGTQKVITTRGNEVDVQYELVEADDLIVSHRDDLSKNPAYPQEIQPRQRDRAASAQQVAKIAANLRPELLGVSPKAGGGAPIVGSDGVVESGNGRVLAVVRAYRQGFEGAQKYRDWLVEQGYEQAAGMREPILIRRRLTEMTMEERARFAREANTGTTLGMSTAEQAASDAAEMPAGILEQYQGGNIGAADNRRFVTAFAKAIVPEGEQARFFTGEGQLSQEGRARIENALFARAYGNPELLATLREDLDNNIRGLGNALIQAAPDWAQMRAAVARGEVPAELDITPDLLAVIERIGRARAEGVKPQDAMAQIDAFAGAPSPAQEAIFGWFYEGGRARAWAKVAGYLQKYATEAAKASTGPNLLGMAPVTSEQLLATVGAQAGVGMPSRARVAAEAGGARSIEATSMDVGAQAEPFQASVRPEPSGNLTMRAQTPPTIEGAETTSKKDLELGDIDPSGRIVIQSFSNWKEGRKQALQLKNGYVKALRQVAKATGATFVAARVKKFKMLRDKIAQGRSPNSVSDYLGGRLLVKDPAILGLVLEEVRAKWRVLEEENFLETPKAGYRAVHMQVEIAPGFTAELQIVPETIGKVQNKVHVLYNKWKRVSGTISSEQMQERDQDLAKIRGIFDQAWLKSPFNLLQSVLRDKAGALRVPGAQGTIDLTDQGEQQVIPGAEQISQREFIERQMEGRKKPKRAQKEADEGLFDLDARGQLEMFAGVNFTAAQKQWAKIAERAMDYIADLSWMQKISKGYPFRDPHMMGLGKEGQKRYLDILRESLGRAWRTERMANHLGEIFEQTTPEESRAVFEYLTTKDADPRMIPHRPVMVRQRGRVFKKRAVSLRNAAVAAKSTIKKLGRELVRRGELSQEAYEAHADAYLPRVYLKYLLERDAATGGAALKIGTQGWKMHRIEDLPAEYRDLYLGEIKDPAFLVRRALAIPAWDMAMQDFLHDIAGNPEWILPEGFVEWKPPGLGGSRKVTPYWLKAEAQALRDRSRQIDNTDQAEAMREIAEEMDALGEQGLGLFRDQYARPIAEQFEQLPDSPRYGDLRGAYVRKDIWNDIMGSRRLIMGEETAIDKLGEISRAATAMWKLSKVPLNLPTVVRNFVSNMILMNLGGDVRNPPLRMIQALREIRNNGEHYRVAIKHGVPASTYKHQELADATKDVLRLRGEARGGALGWGYKAAAKVAGRLEGAADFYQFLETWGKTAVIIDQMRRGATERDAVAKAQEALFDYSAVPNWLRQIRRHPFGTPFVTFFYKALPATLRGAARHPGRIFLYYALPVILGEAIIKALQNVDDDAIEALLKALPEWMQDKGSVMLWPVQDKKGRWQAIDISYFLPWGAHEEAVRSAGKLVQGDFAEGGRDLFQDFGIFGGPIPQVIAAITTGVDTFTGRNIFELTDPPRIKVIKALNYAWRLGAPTWLTDIGFTGHMYRSITDQPNYRGDPPLTALQAAARLVGVNIYPVNPEDTRERNLSRYGWEIGKTTKAMRNLKYDRSLSDEEREARIEEYTEMRDYLIERRDQYEKESRVHPRLRLGVQADRQ